MWTKVDDHLHSHRKVLRVWRENRGALGLHLLALSHAGQAKRDGEVSVEFVEEKLPKASERRKLVAVLVRERLWDELPDGGWQIHDYLEYNPCLEQIQARNLAENRRKRLARRPALLGLVRERDRDHCRYCGERVQFESKRNGTGAAFDLVIPDGPVSRENIVLCCRRCMGLKGSLPPEQAGLTLLPEPAPQLALDARNSTGLVGMSAKPAHPPTRPDPTRPEGVVQT